MEFTVKYVVSWSVDTLGTLKDEAFPAVHARTSAGLEYYTE